MDYYIEPKKISSDGICYPFSSHYQEHTGTGIMAHSHIHNSIELIYCITGSCEALLENTKYMFKAGDLLLINSSEVHSIIAKDAYKTGYIVIQFEPSLLYTTEKSVLEARYIFPFMLSNSPQQRVFLKDTLDSTPVPDLIKSVLSEWTEQKYGFELAVRAGLCNLFVWILRELERRGMNFKNICKQNTIKRFQDIFTFVDINYAEDITANDAAKISNMSYSYFSRMFKNITGLSFTEYLNSVRISKAIELLIKTDMSITEIAVETGFTTPSYFIYKFKKQKSLSPKTYRERFKGSAI